MFVNMPAIGLERPHDLDSDWRRVQRAFPDVCITSRCLRVLAKLSYPAIETLGRSCRESRLVIHVHGGK
jgi:hypothetical protein